MIPAKPKKLKPERRPLFFTVRKALLIDATGEVLPEPQGVLVPRGGLMRRYMRERKYHVNTELQADVKKARDYKQLQVMHGLGLMCIEQIERFAEFGKDAHACIKALQLESGIECEVIHMDAAPVIEAVLAGAETVVGKLKALALRSVLPIIRTIPVKRARSLSYESMDAGKFNEFFNALCSYVLREYWPQLDEETGRAKIMSWIGEQP